MLQRLKTVFLKRWKRFLFFYFIACIMTMYETGISNIYYLMPVKILLAWGLTCDNGHFGGPSFYRNLIINFIIGIISMVLLMVLVPLVCFILGIDSALFVGSVVPSK